MEEFLKNGRIYIADWPESISYTILKEWGFWWWYKKFAESFCSSERL